MYEKQEQIKKALKNFCKHLREARLLNGEQDYTVGKPVEFPKAVLTVSQMRLNTGSINCGYKEYLRDNIFDSEAFKEFAEKIEKTNQFNTRKLKVLTAMEMYLSNKGSHFAASDCLSIYGTKSFHYIWEKVFCLFYSCARQQA